MSELATIATRVWQVCPECRPKHPAVPTYVLAYQAGGMWAWEAYHTGQGSTRLANDKRFPEEAELLIIGACVKWLSIGGVIERMESGFACSVRASCPGRKYAAETVATSEAIALLMACEELSKKEAPRG